LGFLAEISLTQGLLAAAALVLVGLVVHGWWTTRRAGPLQAQRNARPSAHGETAEAGTAAADGVARSAGADSRVEPSLGLDAETDLLAAAPGLGDKAFGPGHLRHGPRLDAAIDALVPLALENPVTGQAVVLHLPPTRRAGSKPFYIEGLDTETGTWEQPAPGRHYRELQAGLQLVNRGGPVNEIEYSEFVQKVQGFADTLQATPSFPDMLEVVDDARKLDAATHPLDAQLTLTLRANGVAWSLGYIQQCAARHGFVASAMPGRLVLPSQEEGAPPVLTLAVDVHTALAALGATGSGSPNPQAGALRHFTLSLDVPQTPQTDEPFPAWHQAAKALADDMDATIVDDYGQPLPLSAFPSIAQELAELYKRLDALELPAGSAAARRLFS